MAKVKILRAALSEIQKLSYELQGRVLSIINRLSQHEYQNTRHLKGWDGLLRTRVSNLRVVWRRDGENILILKVGYRQDIYRDLPHNNRENSLLWQELELVHENADGEDIQEISTVNTLWYQWYQQKDHSWYEFVYGGYRNAPILTDEQEQIYNQLLNSINNYNIDHKAWLLQSAPGTGKTVCAALLACRLHQQLGWRVIFLVPDKLVEELKKYPEVQQQQTKFDFWLGTFRDWLRQIDIILATPQEELEALRNAAKYTLKPYQIDQIQFYDVVLYQAFAINEYYQISKKNAIYQVNETRIEMLKKISFKTWQTELNGRLCRLDAAQQLLIKSPNFSANQNTIFIIDEAQDFLLTELQTLISFCKQEGEYRTYFWLLGDLNQQIQPTDFHWDQLQLGKEISLECNYRNSQHILKFANHFLEFANQENSAYKGKHLPVPANPENALEIGEPVRLLEFSTRQEALDFLHQLSQESQEENRRYLLHDLANTVKVLSINYTDLPTNLVVLNAEQAKGREFTACVAFCLFEGSGTPSLKESFKWYTMLTRARSRLLVIATTTELERIGHQYFQNCDRIDAERAISWITEVASDVDLNQITDDVERRLLARCKSGYLYWDTYLALQLAGVDKKALYEWEKKAIRHLKKLENHRLETELKNIQNISLRCLLLRAMDYSWKAVEVAEQLKENNQLEYAQLLERIATDLESKNLIYEANRVRLLIDNQDESLNLAYWQEISSKQYKSASIITLICEAFTSNIDNVLENKEINQ